MTPKDRNERIAQLTSAWLDERATDEELAELNDLLKGDPDACEGYLDLAETHASLTFIHAGDSLAEPVAGPVQATAGAAGRRSRTRQVLADPSRWLPLAAALMVLLAGWTVMGIFRGPSTQAEPMFEGGIAVLSRLVDAEWPVGTPSRAEGDILQAGVFRLESGLAQVEFFSGASVIVEGPAELNLLSAWVAECRSGRLHVSVPEPALGFVIETKGYRAVDLGTEFALSVTEDGKSEVHVIEGEVRLDDRSGRELRTLTSGMGVRANDHDHRDFDLIREGASEFVTRRQLMALAHDGWRTRYADWSRSRRDLLNSDHVIALFDFENQQPWDRQLVNHAKGKSGGAIVGAQWTEGRWPGKGALEFKRITDRVLVNVPGEFEALTLATSVRVEGFDWILSSLLLTDGFDPGELHWQISQQGALNLGIAGPSPPFNIFSPSVIQPKDLGRWLHLAVTVDRESGWVRQYLNGNVVSEHRNASLPPLRIGTAEIGNWQPGNHAYPVRSLNGTMDELLVFDRALSASEVRALSGQGLE